MAVKEAASPAKPSAVVAGRAPRGLMRRKCACSGGGSHGGPCQCPEEKKKDGMVQRSSAGSTALAAPPIVQSALNAPGRPLDGPTRSLMESRFGHDFGQVRVHTGALAGESARAVNAHAYTVGHDVVFDHGKYDPHSAAGRRLLAHELTHTVQQGGLQRSATGDGGLDVGAAHSSLEAEADHVAERVVGGAIAPSIAATGESPRLSRTLKGTGSPGPTELDESKLKKAPVPPSLATKGVTRLEASSDAGTPSRAAVAVFPLPPGKGPKAQALYEKLVDAKQLQAFVKREAGTWKTSLKQFGANTPELRTAWLEKVGWKEEDAAEKWYQAGGDKTVSGEWKPRVGGKTCDMDHILELQIGGVNARENVQVLDAGPNRSSGSTIRAYLEDLAIAIGLQIAASPSDDLQIAFDSVPKGAGPVAKPAGPGKATSGIEVECNLESVVGAEMQAAAPPGSILTQLYSGAIPATIYLPKSGFLPIDEKTNQSAALLVPAFLLKKYVVATGKGKSKQDTVEAVVDKEHLAGKRPTKFPIELDKSVAGKPVHFNAVDDGSEEVALATGDAKGPAKVAAQRRKLEFAEKNARLKFIYPWLSPVDIAITAVSEEGVTGQGSLTVDRLPVLRGRKLDVSLAPGELAVKMAAEKKGAPPIPGARITNASLSGVLLPDLGVTGQVDLEFGPESRPIAVASLTLTGSSDAGIAARGKLALKIPRLEKAEGIVEWTPAGGWKGEIRVEAGQIGIPLVKSSTLVVTFTNEGPMISGTVGLEVRDQVITLSALREKNRWVFAGEGTFTVPPLGPVDVKLKHDGEHLTGSGRTSFDLRGFRGTIDVGYKDDKVTGKGTLSRKQGKLAGDVTVVLLASGALTAEGKVAYELKPGLVAQVGVKVDENKKVTLSGEMTFPDVQLFPHFGAKKELFRAPGIEIPIFAIPVGSRSIGVVAVITGGLDADYGVGPGTLRKLHLGGQVNPLEEDPNPQLHGGGELHVPFGGGLTPWIQAGIGLSLAVANVTGNIRADARLGLEGAFDASAEIAYAEHTFSIEASAKLAVHPVLAFMLSANVEASVIGMGVVYHQDLARKKFEMGSDLEVGVIVPLKYVHGQPFEPPTFDKIQFIKPDINAGEMLKSLAAKAGL